MKEVREDNNQPMLGTWGNRRMTPSKVGERVSKAEATIQDAREMDVVGSAEATVGGILKSTGLGAFPEGRT